MKKTYRYDPKTEKMVEVTRDRNKGHSLQIIGDMEPFVSPITKEVITGRRAYRDHCKQHNVTNISDFNSPGGYWDKAAKEREKFFTGNNYDTERRKEHLKRAFDKHSRR